MKLRKRYKEELLKAVREYGRILNTTILTGWSRGYYQEFSRCCSTLTYVRSLMEGIPYCAHCNKSLGPNDLRYEWIPPHASEHAIGECPWPTEPEPQ